MKMSFRWYGESDPISLEYISQIPGMRSIVSAVYDVKPGEVWPEESLAKMKADCEAHGLIFDVVESVPVSEDINSGQKKETDTSMFTVRISVAVRIRYQVYYIYFMPVFDWDTYTAGQKSARRIHKPCHVLGSDERAGSAQG